MHLDVCPATDPAAHLLLTHYFTSRELDFPRQLGTYSVRYPDPAQFVPPSGVFLVARGDDGEPLGCGGIRMLGSTDRGRLAGHLRASGPAAADAAAPDPAAPDPAAPDPAAPDPAAPDPAAPVYEVKHVWLEPAARGQGWAGILMADLEERARAFGAHTVVLDTNASLLGAARLYARLGYQNIEAYNDNPNATNWYRKDLD